jgi:hypothetical protein
MHPAAFPASAPSATTSIVPGEAKSKSVNTMPMQASKPIRAKFAK